MTDAPLDNANILIDLALLTMLVLVAYVMVRSRQLFVIVMLAGIYSLLSAAFFVSLDAVDVAFTEAAVGAGVSTVLMLGAMLLSVRREKPVRSGRSPIAILVVTLVGSALIYATARDWARFGYLYLRDGVWNGERALPEGWADFGRTPGPAPNTDTYGAGWWLTPSQGPGRPARSLITDNGLADAFSAQGYEGQIIVVVPSKDLVLVRLGRFDGGAEAWDALGDWATRVIGAYGDRPAR